MRLYLILSIAIFFALSSCNQSVSQTMHPEAKKTPLKVQKTDDEWKKVLSAEEYRILREKGTERAFTGKYYKNEEEGIYTCAACGTELFTSKGKFDSGCGWPSFYEAADNKKIVIQTDYSHGMVRTEIMCAHCGGHLGHLFDDGPKPTGLRYCVNSVSIDFKAVKLSK